MELFFWTLFIFLVIAAIGFLPFGYGEPDSAKQKEIEKLLDKPRP